MAVSWKQIQALKNPEIQLVEMMKSLGVLRLAPPLVLVSELRNYHHPKGVVYRNF